MKDVQNVKGMEDVEARAAQPTGAQDVKGRKTQLVLEAMSYFVGDAADFVKAFLSLPYHSSRSRLEGKMDDLSIARSSRLSALAINKDEVRKLHNAIYKLKRDGLISFQIRNKQKFWNLTSNGIAKLNKLQERIARGLLPSAAYPKEKSGQLVIVTFDIPERERRKRDWLRFVLIGLEYKMLQKSVWFGKTKIPERLLGDIKDLRLTDFVEIFSINKSGSLRQIV